MTTKQAILKALPDLPPSDLAEIIASAKALSSHSAVKSLPENRSTDWLLDGMADYLVAKGFLPAMGAHTTITRRTAYQTYCKKREPVLAYLSGIEKTFGTATRHRHRFAMLCANAHHELLERKKLMSVSAMLSQIDKLPEALESAYPGYARNSLFGFLVDMDAV